MNPRLIEFIVYLVGVAALGLFQGQLRSALGDAVSFGLVIVYLLVLRGLGWVLVRNFAKGAR